MDSIWCQPPAFCPAIRRKPHPERLRSVLQYHAFVIRRTERLKRWHMGRALKLHHKISSPLDCYCKYTFRTCWTSLGMQEIWRKVEALKVPFSFASVFPLQALQNWVFKIWFGFNVPIPMLHPPRASWPDVLQDPPERRPAVPRFGCLMVRGVYGDVARGY